MNGEGPSARPPARSSSATASPRSAPPRRRCRGALRPLHQAPGRRRQVPDRGLRREPLQRAAALGVPGGDGQGLRRPGRRDRRRPGHRGTSAVLRPLGPGARPGALPGDAEAPTGGAGPRAGVPRLGADGGAGRIASRAGGPAWDVGGTRKFIRVLQLLAEHPQSRVARAIDACRVGHALTAEAIIQRTRALAAAEAGRSAGINPSLESTNIPSVSVPPPDLSQFNRLLGGDAAAGQPGAAGGRPESIIET